MILFEERISFDIDEIIELFMIIKYWDNLSYEENNVFCIINCLYIKNLIVLNFLVFLLLFLK